MIILHLTLEGYKPVVQQIKQATGAGVGFGVVIYFVACPPQQGNFPSTIHRASAPSHPWQTVRTPAACPQLSFREGKLRHDPIPHVTPRHPIDVLLLPPFALLKCQSTLKSA